MLTDLDAIFDNGDFAATATIGGVGIGCLFDAPFRAVNPETGMVESSAPAATVKSTDAVARSVAHGTTVTISGAQDTQDNGDYTIVGVEPDGQGMTRLVLEKQ